MRNAGRLTFAVIAISGGLGSPSLLAQDVSGGGALVVHVGSLPKTPEWGTGGDSPVTRRQMAIFIAQALGVSWSGY